MYQQKGAPSDLSVTRGAEMEDFYLFQGLDQELCDEVGRTVDVL